MLTNFSKGSIIYIWSGPESASECNIMKSHKKVAGEALLENGHFYSVICCGSEEIKKKDITIFSGSLLTNYF